jgi:hypothetical protein
VSGLEGEVTSSAGWLLHSNLVVPKALVCPKKPMSTIARTAKHIYFYARFGLQNLFIMIKFKPDGELFKSSLQIEKLY